MRTTQACPTDFVLAQSLGTEEQGRLSPIGYLVQTVELLVDCLGVNGRIGILQVLREGGSGR